MLITFIGGGNMASALISGHLVQPPCLAACHQRPIVEPGFAVRLEQPAAERDVVGFRMDAKGMAVPLPRLRSRQLREVMAGDQSSRFVGLVHGGKRVAGFASLGLDAVGLHIDRCRQCHLPTRDQHILARAAEPDDAHTPSGIASV